MSPARRDVATVRARSSPMAGGIELILDAPEMATTVSPGQFFQLEVSAPDTLLRRPYSVAGIDSRAGRLSFLFSVVGVGSRWLSRLDAGDAVDLIGPLGRGFAPDPARQPVIVAGGLGIAAFPALSAQLVAAGCRPIVLQGARTMQALLPQSHFPGADYRVATDDGSVGRRGTVVSLLETIATLDQDWFVCGPTSMLQAVVALADRRGLDRTRIQVALETPMGCGTGTCLGCVAPAQGGGYLLTCREGPCVRADRVEWDRMEDAFHA